MRHQAFSRLVALLLPGALCLTSLGGCEREAVSESAAPPSVRRLTIITPHNEAIRKQFETGFTAWCEQNRDGELVQIEWIVRGTPQCIEYIKQVFEGGGPSFTTPDVMFGGGIADHVLLAERGQCQSIDLGGALEGIPAEVNGLATRDAEGRWFATGLSSFGIICNRRACDERGIDPPATWDDLADPRFAGWMGVADPGASGSHRQAMMFILQSQGWEQGWSTLIRTLANARGLVDSSSTVLDQVRSGVFLAGYAVNFDGQALADRSGGDLHYVNPEGATAATPDVTSVLRSAPNLDLPRAFLRYCLSESGQMAWSAKDGEGGNGNIALYHYPIDPRIYEKHSEVMAVQGNPFETSFGLKVDVDTAVRQRAALVPLVRAACGDNHILLQRAWAAVVASGMNEEAMAELCAPPIEEEAAYKLGAEYSGGDAAARAKLVDELGQRFRAKYERVLELAGG